MLEPEPPKPGASQRRGVGAEQRRGARGSRLPTVNSRAQEAHGPGS